MEIDNIYGYGYFIIDIRDEVSFNINYLKNSKNISFYKLLANPSFYLDKNKYYLLICEHGIESLKTSEILNKMGYHTFSLKGGIEGIIRKGNIH